MKKEFIPIAMKCNQEQFDAIIPKLKDFEIIRIDPFDNYEYLVNNGGNQTNTITNISDDVKSTYNREVHETWNEKTFLEACGIEVEETFTITKAEINKLHDMAEIMHLPMFKSEIRLMFPSAFEPGEKELVVDFTGWCKTNLGGNEKYLSYFDKGIMNYGFDGNGDWFDNHKYNSGINSNHYEATQQEVEKALKDEILKRYKPGQYFKSLHSEWNIIKLLNNFDFDFQHLDEGIIYVHDYVIYQNGIFAEIIQPKKMTQAEIETELGHNIEIV